MLRTLMCILFIRVASRAPVDALKAADIVVKLQQINAHFGIETNVLIRTVTASEDDDDDGIGGDLGAFVVPQMPTLIVSGAVSHQLIDSIDKNLLAVVFVGGTVGVLRLSPVLNALMTRLHDQKLLFVLGASLLDDDVTLQLLFDWCWQEGYTRVLALYAHARAPQVMRAATYRAFPRVHIVPVAETAQYFATAVSFDFQGQRLRTPLATDPPLVFRLPSAGRRRYAGMFYEILATFAAHHNATLVEAPLPPPYPDTLVYRDALTAVRIGAVDISVHCYFADPRRWHTNYPIFLAAQYFQVPHAQPRDGDQYPLLPFAGSLWQLIAVYVLAATLCAHVAFRTEWTRWLQTFVGALLQALPLLCNSANATRPRADCDAHGRRMWVLQVVGGFYVANAYATLLTSLLTTGVYGPQLRTTADVVASHYRIEFGAYELRFFPNDEQLRQKLLLVDDATLARSQRELNTDAVRLITEWKHRFYARRQLRLRTPRVRLLDGEVVWSVVGGFNMPLTSPYVERLSDFTFRFFDAGLIGQAYAMAERDGRKAGILEPLVDNDAAAMYDGRALDTTYFRWMWYLLGGGYVVSGCALLSERLWSRSQKH